MTTAWWLALSGCSAPLDLDGWYGEPRDSGSGPCSTTVLGTSPTGDAVNRHRLIAIDLPPDSIVDAYEIEMDVEMDTFRGWETVPGSITVRDGPLIRVEFEPDEPLAALTRHAVHASTPWCDPVVHFEFSTSEIGNPVPDPAAAIGLSYVANAANATLNRHGPDAGNLAPTGAIRFVVEDFTLTGDPKLHTTTISVSREPLDVYGAPSPPVTLAGIWANPTFRLAGLTFPLYLVDGQPIELQDVTLSGDISPDLEKLAGLLVSGKLDLRTVLVGTDSGYLCSVLSETGDCVPCSDGERYCAVVELRDWTAQQIRY